jgi:hypothetical protein
MRAVMMYAAAREPARPPHRDDAEHATFDDPRRSPKLRIALNPPGPSAFFHVRTRIAFFVPSGDIADAEAAFRARSA